MVLVLLLSGCSSGDEVICIDRRRPASRGRFGFCGRLWHRHRLRILRRDQLWGRPFRWL